MGAIILLRFLLADSKDDFCPNRDIPLNGSDANHRIKLHLRHHDGADAALEGNVLVIDRRYRIAGPKLHRLVRAFDPLATALLAAQELDSLRDNFCA